jgi:hypothetical protein
MTAARIAKVNDSARKVVERFMPSTLEDIGDHKQRLEDRGARFAGPELFNEWPVSAVPLGGIRRRRLTTKLGRRIAPRVALRTSVKTWSGPPGRWCLILTVKTDSLAGLRILVDSGRSYGSRLGGVFGTR